MDANKSDGTKGVEETGEGIEQAREVWRGLSPHVAAWANRSPEERTWGPSSIAERRADFARTWADEITRYRDYFDRGASTVDERWKPAAKWEVIYNPEADSWTDVVYSARGFLDLIDFDTERYTRVSVIVERLERKEGTLWDWWEAESEGSMGESGEQGLGDTSTPELSGDWERDSFEHLRLLRNSAADMDG